MDVEWGAGDAGRLALITWNLSEAEIVGERSFTISL
jgi:hypothetical protein